MVLEVLDVLGEGPKEYYNRPRIERRMLEAQVIERNRRSRPNAPDGGVP